MSRTAIFMLPIALVASAGSLRVRAQQPPATPREAAVRQHVRAIEGSAERPLENVIAEFERTRLAPPYLAGTTAEARRTLIAAMRSAASDAGAVRVSTRDDQYVMTLEGDRVHEVAFRVEHDPPFRIVSLAVATAAPTTTAGPALRLAAETLAASFDRLGASGWSGVVHIRLPGKPVFERAFGAANQELDAPMSLQTIFGTGSQPIDLTVAAISLLEQDGRLGFDDPISRFIPGVPRDKQTMTIRHLLTDRSGLPDFFHRPTDWNPDLAWIDRDAAERRLMTLPLRFAPGTDRAHSHAGFGLLAAIVEHAAGVSYGDFLRERIFTPAGMTRTGFNGQSLGLPAVDFAVGGGPERVGVPNIPPNWGPNSISSCSI